MDETNFQINGAAHDDFKSERILIEDVDLEYEPNSNKLVDVTSRVQLSHCKPGELYKWGCNVRL